jgi:hypothetical protein
MTAAYRSVLATLLLAICWTSGFAPGAEPRFTPLVRLPAPRVIACATPWPGGVDAVEHILDDNAHTWYASHSKGLDTFIDFDFGKATHIAGFRHVDRRNRANVDAADLVFSNDPKFREVLKRIPVRHTGLPLGVTHAAFPPVAARYVRWQVTAFSQLAELGGVSIGFFTTAAAEPSPSQARMKLTAVQVLQGSKEKPVRPLRVELEYPYLEPVTAVLEVTGQAPRDVPLRFGGLKLDLPMPAAAEEKRIEAALKLGGKTLLSQSISVKPVRPWTIYLLPHSHVDVGYTHVQDEVLKRQWEHLELAMELARRTADRAPGERFKWNCEVLWAVDQYLAQATPQKRQALLDAVQKGWLHLDGTFSHQLTALCRPEELFEWMAPARRLSRQYGLTIESAMISDVPGYTWGIIPALAQSGIKYFSIGPNDGHRIGRTRRAWSDRPFYWKSPSGQDRVLCWMAGKGYSWFLSEPGLNAERFVEYVTELESENYPYDMVQVRYSIGADNGPPDPELPGFVTKFNAQHLVPKLKIATTSEMFREFDRRYGATVLEARGDFTPYWEDGAGSSARETALARNAAERLVQAETLWALLRPNEYPAQRFDQAWRNVLLYNEHTWGAHCSITKPDDPFTLAQWKIKQAFADNARSQSVELLETAAAKHRQETGPVSAVDVLNTASWTRSGLVELPREFSREMPRAGDVVQDSEGRTVASQRSTAGGLMFVARDVPPFAAKRFFLRPGKAVPSGQARAEGNRLSGKDLRLVIDEKSGAIGSLTFGEPAQELVRKTSGGGLNEYVYVPGRDPKDQQGSGPVAVRVEEPGPLVASLVVSGAAPGCRGLTREVRLIDGLDEVHIRNTVDKTPVRTKEGVYFRFALNMPEGEVRMDVPWAVVRPELDQLPGACKNYFTVGRWLDVSNRGRGLTLATVDAPLVQLGAVRTDVLPNPMDAACWLERLEPSQDVYSYVMNNYWETNYKADQEGRTEFRYALRPHRAYDPIAAQRFGIEQGQPLIAVPVAGDAPQKGPPLTIEPPCVMASMVRPVDGGKAWVLRLFNAGGEPAQARLTWHGPAPKRVTLSSPFEDEGAAVSGPISMPPLGIVTVKAVF